MDSVIESGFYAGHFIGWREGSYFVSGLHHLESEIQSIVATDLAQATTLYVRPAAQQKRGVETRHTLNCYGCQQNSTFSNSNQKGNPA